MLSQLTSHFAIHQPGLARHVARKHAQQAAAFSVLTALVVLICSKPKQEQDASVLTTAVHIAQGCTLPTV